MVLADLGRKITTALRSLSSATVINEEVSVLLSAIIQLFKAPYIHMADTDTVTDSDSVSGFDCKMTDQWQ